MIRAWALGGLLWWTAGTLPLAGILPNWNAWRSSLPGLGLGVAFAALFARGRAWPVLLLLAVRAGALLLASPAPALVSSQGPPTTSHLSFVRLVRLQRTLEATRTVLLHEARPARGGLVRYWNYPWMSEFAFAGPAAIQVWLGDPTAQWGPFGGATGFQDTTTPVIAFNPDSIRLAVRIHPEAQRLLLLAHQAMRAGRLVEADAQLARALAIQTVPSVRLRAVVLANRSAVRLSLGDLRGADSLHRAGIDAIPSIEWLREERTLALALGDTVRARRAMMVSRQIEGRTPGTGGAPAR
ncbi:MAG: hypothetical protein A2V63_00215 [Candidatus Eisenbacteria bacterium RBG_19FT_COMBO_70_11]|nr:MAG: hypothetical protein A2V63_00215 [Candidatus Eisenbacteria bacterium RBG_19FT_COMBO_70_11]